MQNIEIKEFRKILSDTGTSNKKMLGHNNLLMLLGISTNFVVLTDHGLKNGMTTWSVGKRPYEVEEISNYQDRDVYVISHVNNEVSLKIFIDAENFSILRNEYHSKQAADDFENYFWKYKDGPLQCGFYKTDQIYEYKEFQGKMYPHFFSRTDYSRCFDVKRKIAESESVGSYQALITSTVLNIKPPADYFKLKKQKGISELNYIYHPEFWEHYNIIKDLSLDDDILKELGGREGLNKKFNE